MECILASVLKPLQGRCVWYIRYVYSCASYMNDKDLQRPYQPGVREQIATGWDIYLSIIREVQQRLDAVLRHDMPNWRALNSCPCCQYEVCEMHLYSISTDLFKLMDEPQLKYRKISIMDGNTSLRQVDRHQSASKQIFHSKYFLSVDEVNQFEKRGASHLVCFGLASF